MLLNTKETKLMLYNTNYMLLHKIYFIFHVEKWNKCNDSSKTKSDDINNTNCLKHFSW